MEAKCNRFGTAGLFTTTTSMKMSGKPKKVNKKLSGCRRSQQGRFEAPIRHRNPFEKKSSTGLGLVIDVDLEI